MTKRKDVKEFYYTKANGDRSHRRLVVLRYPQKLYLGLDVTDCTNEEIEDILDGIETADKCRDEVFESMGVSSLWRSFKEEGIEWVDE